MTRSVITVLEPVPAGQVPSRRADRPHHTQQHAEQADPFAAQRAAATAAAKARKLWPDVIGEVLADEIMAVLDLPPWLRSQTRTQRLIEAILSIREGAPNPVLTE